jgi:hypothetical protein
MSARDKAIIAVLGVVILVALIGIGILVARLVTGDEEAEIRVVTPTLSTAASSGGTPGVEAAITAVAPPSLDAQGDMPPKEIKAEQVAIAQAEGVGPLAPVIIASQALQAGHRYRIEVAAKDGLAVAIQGSWSQAATSASGQVTAPQIEFFEGSTPFTVDVVAPVADPALWSCSVSAAPKALQSSSASLVITIWDVTGVK